MSRYRDIFIVLLLWFCGLSLNAQQPQSSDYPVFVNEGETVTYHIQRDPQAQQGTVSDALQNVPGVKVDTEGNISLRGVNEVEIFINGKPSHFDPESQKNYLQQISAASIERIEVMTNPSVRYTSTSGIGIINIVTISQGLAEQHLNLGFQANTTPELSPWISYIWTHEKLAFTANLKGTLSNDISNTYGYSYSFVDSQKSNTDTTSYSRYHKTDTTRQYNIELFLKAEYHPNSRNDFSAFFNITPWWANKHTLTNTYRHEYIDDIGEYNYFTDSYVNQNFAFGSGGIAWQHRFTKEGHSLGVQFNSNYDFGSDLNRELRHFEEQSFLNRDIRKTDQFVDIGWDTKVEYTLPYSKRGELYLALTDILAPDNNVEKYDTISAQGYVTDWKRSENREFSRNQLAGIVMVQHRFGPLTVKPGISLEYATSNLRHLDTPEYDTLLHFMYWRPSLHLSYRTPTQHNFSLSYTRKTSYPYARQFSSRIFYDEESFFTGNPMLRPTLIDIFELAWAKYWERFGSVNVKLYYNNSIDAINMVSDVAYDELWGRVVPFSQPVNLNKYFETGSEFNVTYRPNTKFNVRLDANVFDSYIETFYDKTSDSLIRNEMWAYNLRLSTWAKLWNKLEVHATAYYNSPTQTLFATNQTAYGINCGLRADFFDKRLSLLLNANDIFNWNKEDNYTYNPYYVSYSSYKANSRYVSVEIIYKIL